MITQLNNKGRNALHIAAHLNQIEQVKSILNTIAVSTPNLATMVDNDGNFPIDLTTDKTIMSLLENTMKTNIIKPIGEMISCEAISIAATKRKKVPVFN